jgi:AcrR family transcriptional regulator
VDKRRARTDADKVIRRGEIVAAARTAFDGAELNAFTMDVVASKLGLAKGTVYRYFPSREGLLLAVLHDDLAEWFDVVDTALGTASGERAAADHLVRALVDRPRLMRLLAILPSILEQNVPHDTAWEFKAFLLHRSAVTGALIDRAVGARRGSGVRLLVHLNAGVIGLYLGAHPAPVVAMVLAEPDFAPLRVDLRRELIHLARALIGAMPRKGTNS